jgi:hypothetical protein
MNPTTASLPPDTIDPAIKRARATVRIARIRVQEREMIRLIIPGIPDHIITAMSVDDAQSFGVELIKTVIEIQNKARQAEAPKPAPPMTADEILAREG